MRGAGRLSRWTRWFVLASAVGLVAVEWAALAGYGRVTLATIALFGFVSPMVFGMGYLLLPAVVGTTLSHQRLPGLHFGLTVVGSGSLVAVRLFDVGETVLTVGVVCWSVGVTIFLGTLAVTVLPAVRERPAIVVGSEDRPQRSTRLATGAIPVALGYLATGTVGLLAWAGLAPAWGVAFPQVVHYYGAGFGALLIFALGVRLMPGFFHVTPPRRLSWVVLGAGAIGPALLGTYLLAGPLFQIGAIFEATAVASYAVVVGYVFQQSEWRRVGFYGILLGALAGVAAVGVALTMAFDAATVPRMETHARLILGGFFPLTIVGYAYQFFPVTSGQFRGASERIALLTLGLLASGVTLQGVGQFTQLTAVASAGSALSLVGVLGYAYLVGRRLWTL